MLQTAHIAFILINSNKLVVFCLSAQKTPLSIPPLPLACSSQYVCRFSPIWSTIEVSGQPRSSLCTLDLYYYFTSSAPEHYGTSSITGRSLSPPARFQLKEHACLTVQEDNMQARSAQEGSCPGDLPLRTSRLPTLFKLRGLLFSFEQPRPQD
jgi:hypothetical protein